MDGETNSEEQDLAGEQKYLSGLLKETDLTVGGLFRRLREREAEIELMKLKDQVRSGR